MFCVATGFRLLYISPQKTSFFFVFVLFYEMNRLGSIESRKYLEEYLQVDVNLIVSLVFCHVLFFRSVANLDRGNRVDTTTFLRPSLDFAPYLSYPKLKQ